MKSDSKINIIGTVHIDPSGRQRLGTLLDKLSQKKVILEIPYPHLNSAFDLKKEFNLFIEINE